MGLRDLLIRALPSSAVDRIRRRRAVRRYLRDLADELLRRHSRLEAVEEDLATGPGGFYERVVKEILERTDLVLQQLDRRLEGQAARDDARLRGLEEEIATLRQAVVELRATLDPRLARPAE
jgi:hypothetical protein